MKFELDIRPDPASPYAENFIGEVIRSQRFRVIIRSEKQCWELQVRPSYQKGASWQHMAFNRSREAISKLWFGLHGISAQHCWPELMYLPAIFGGG